MIANAVAFALMAALPVGIGLAIITDNSSWLMLSGVAFIILYAG
jgi:hypothetical protein